MGSRLGWLRLGVCGPHLILRRRLAPVRDGAPIVSLAHHERIARLGMLVEGFRQQDDRVKIHRAAPELAEKRALEPHVLHVLGVLGLGDGRDFLIH